MTLTPQQKQRLELGNTVNLPPYFPSPGSISLVEPVDDENPIVCIEESDTAEKVIRRYVRLDQIVGVFAVAARNDREACDYEVVSNRIEDMLTRRELLDRLKRQPIVRGIAAVNATASVLVQLESGMSAVESRFPFFTSINDCDPTTCCCLIDPERPVV